MRKNPTPGGWVVVAGTNNLKNADDLHVTRAWRTKRFVLSEVFAYRADARKAKNALLKEKNLRPSMWLQGCEIDP